MDATTVRVQLELQFDGDSIRGALTDEAGTRVDIVGRIGLLAAIDALAEREADGSAAGGRAA
jgi:hypothetical protein